MGLQYTERMGKYDRGVLVFAEVAQGALTTLAREMLGAGHRLADVLGEPLLAAVRGHGIAEAAQEAVFHAADTVYAADTAALAQYQTLTYCGVMAQIAQHAIPNILLIGMGSLGRDRGRGWLFVYARAWRLIVSICASILRGSVIKRVNLCFDVVPPRADNSVLCHG